MGLLQQVLMAPLGPMRLAFWTIDQLIEAAAREHYNPAAIRRELAELSRQFDEGTISFEEFDAREDELLDRLAECQQARFPS